MSKDLESILTELKRWEGCVCIP